MGQRLNHLVSGVGLCASLLSAAPAHAECSAGADCSSRGAPDAQPSRSAGSAPRSRHSTAMMAGGIVMVSLAPLALFSTILASARESVCEGEEPALDGTRHVGSHCGRYRVAKFGLLAGGAALLGVGIPLIVIGAKREPEHRPSTAQATISSWLTPNAAGVGLRLDL